MQTIPLCPPARHQATSASCRLIWRATRRRTSTGQPGPQAGQCPQGRCGSRRSGRDLTTDHMRSTDRRRHGQKKEISKRKSVGSVARAARAKALAPARKTEAYNALRHAALFIHILRMRGRGGSVVSFFGRGACCGSALFAV